MRYRNLDPSAQTKGFADVLRWMIRSGRPVERWARWRDPVPREEVDVRIFENSKECFVLWIGHSTFVLHLDGCNVLCDPVFSPRLGPIRRYVPPALAPEELPSIHLVCISHNHYDHLDLSALRKIVRRDRPLVVVPEGLGKWLAKRIDSPVEELSWWKTLPFSPVTVTAVPAQHWSKRTPWDTNRSHWCGFVIAASRLLYFAGDTGYHPVFREIGERFSLDAALLPIGAYAPRWFMRMQHMDPEEAGQAFLDLKARFFVPMHWGTYQLSAEDVLEPPQRLREWWRKTGLPEDRLRLLAVGGVFRLP